MKIPHAETLEALCSTHRRAGEQATAVVAFLAATPPPDRDVDHFSRYNLTSAAVFETAQLKSKAWKLESGALSSGLRGASGPGADSQYIRARAQEYHTYMHTHTRTVGLSSRVLFSPRFVRLHSPFFV